MTAAPETAPLGAADLRLRGDPPPVMRLSRKTLATAGLVAAAGIGGALIYALQPQAPSTPTELYDTDNRATTDSLAGAPKDYAQVPRLGPPLPGDLGKPILSAQQRGVDVSPPPIGVSPPPPGSGAANPAQAARERARQERDAARVSKVFIGSEAAQSATGATAPMASPATATASDSAPGSAGGNNAAGSGDQAAKRSFLRAGDSTPTESSHRLVRPSSPYMVLAGSVIPAALITGIRSDLPGTITAQVTQNVYDSVTGRHVLVPQGSRLIGEYDSQVTFGQNRVLLAWNRLILPDGRSILLDRLPSADAGGYSGLQDRVNQHWGGMFRAALISTLLSVGTEISNGDEDELVRALRQGSSDTVGRTGQDLVRRQMSVQPTLTIRPGFQLRVIVTRDLVMAPEGEAR